MSEQITQATVHDVGPANDSFGSFFLGIREFAFSTNVIADVVNAPERFVPQPMAPDCVVGITTIRDITIPVLDLSRMLKLPDTRENHGQRKLAIVEHDQFLIGVLIDQTGEVFSRHRSRCTFTPYEGVSQAEMVTGAFRFEETGRVIQVIDSAALIDFHGVTTSIGSPVSSYHRTRRQDKQGLRRQSVHFRIGGANLGVDLNQIREIIKVGKVDIDLTATGLLPGIKKLRDKDLGLVDLGALLEVKGHGVDKPIGEKHVLVVSCADQWLGLVVDQIEDIIKYYSDDLVGYPMYRSEHTAIFCGCLVTQQSGEIIQIDVQQLLNLPAVATALTNYRSLLKETWLTDPDEQGIEADPDGKTQEIEDKGVESFDCLLTFTLDRSYALPVLDVSEVVDFPDALLDPPHKLNNVAGILDLRGELITVACAKSLYGLDGLTDQAKQIVLFPVGNSRMGLAVKSIDSIVRVSNRVTRAVPKGSLEVRAIAEDATHIARIESKSKESFEDAIVLSAAAIGQRFKSDSLRHADTAPLEIDQDQANDDDPQLQESA